MASSHSSLSLCIVIVLFCCRITGTPQQLPRALEILSQHFKANPPREKPGGAPPAVAALLVRPGMAHTSVYHLEMAAADTMPFAMTR